MLIIIDRPLSLLPIQPEQIITIESDDTVTHPLLVIDEADVVRCGWFNSGRKPINSKTLFKINKNIYNM